MIEPLKDHPEYPMTGKALGWVLAALLVVGVLAASVLAISQKNSGTALSRRDAAANVGTANAGAKTEDRILVIPDRIGTR